MIFLLSIIIFLPKILIGFGLASLLWKDSDFPAILLKLAIGVPLGFAISSSLFFLTLLAGVSPSTYSQIEFWLSLVLIAVLMIRSIPTVKLSWKPLTFSREEIIGAGIVIVGMLLSISAFLYYARLHPYGFEDAWSIWNFTARHIYRSNSGDIILHSQQYQRFNPDYPVNLVLNIAWGWFVLHNETVRLPMAAAFLMNFSPVATLWAGLRKWRGIFSSALGALILLMLPNLPSVVGQYADPLVALHFLAAVVLFYGYLRTSQNGLLILVGLLTGFSAWAKNEGFLFIAVFTVVFALAAHKHFVKWSNIRWFGIGTVFPLLVVLLYKWTVHSQNYLFRGGNSFVAQILDGARWQIILQSLVRYIIAYGNWPVSAILILITFAVLAGFAREEVNRHWWLLLIFAGQLAGYFFIYLITPADLPLHIKTSFDRLISHIYPLIIFWIFVVSRSPASIKAPPEKS